MVTKKRVHFFVCFAEQDLIARIKVLCERNNIAPDFLYRRFVNCVTDIAAPEEKVTPVKMPIVSRDLERIAALPELMDYATYFAESKDNTVICNEILTTSQDSIVSCVRIHTNWTQLFSAVLFSKVFTRTVVLYHQNKRKMDEQKRIFQSLSYLPKPLQFADTVEEIFMRLQAA